MSRPGNPAFFSSFYNPGTDLLTIGAYTGFKNTGDLKRLLVCRPMLEIATAMMNDGCLQELDWDAIFTSIEAFHADTDVLETQFGEGVNLRECYPEININRVEMEDLHNAAEYFAKFQANREARAGAYLYRLMQRLGKYAEEDTTERMFESEEARNAFGLALNRVSVTLPNPDPANVVVPQQIFKPMSKKGESIMEVFNRLWYLLQKLFYDIKSKAPKNILLCKNPFQSRKIPGQYIPVWMRNDTQQRRKTAFETPLSSKAFAYSWGKSLDDESAKRILQGIEGNIKREGFLDDDPGVEDEVKFRDNVAHQFRLTEYGLQLCKVVIDYSFHHEGLDSLVTDECDWGTEILPILNETLEEHLTISFGVRMLCTSESSPPDFSHNTMLGRE
ncbi:hypothetical protein B0J14DRAFT_707462 [Halenospora varia]|nr:hypothetical protein B0J14DRAFT_707462 [Halenospora varia]